MENISNQLIGLIILIIGIVVGWLFNDLWRSARERRRISGVLFKISKRKRPTYDELFTNKPLKNETRPIDIEYTDGKFQWPTTKEDAIGFPNFEDMK